MIGRRSPSRRALTRLVQFLLPVVVVIAVAGCDPTPVAVGATTLPPPHVNLFGDSHSVLAQDEFGPLAARRYDVDYRAKFGTYVGNWGWQILYDDPGPVVVLALGSNDWKSLDPLGAWRSVLDLMPGDRCVVWLRPSDPNSTVAAANEQTAAVIGEHPKVRVFDWRARIGPHPEWYGPDGVHYSAAGQAAYAQALIDAIGLCG